MNPIQWWTAWRRKRHDALITAKILELDQSGAGIEYAWAEPGTTPMEIAEWFDNFMGDSPHVVPRNVPEIEVFVVFAGHMDEAIWEAGPDGTERPAEDILIRWEGTRTAWWKDGRDQCLAAIPPEHQGIYVCANSIGRVFAALRNQPTTHSLRSDGASVSFQSRRTA